MPASAYALRRAKIPSMNRGRVRIALLLAPAIAFVGLLTIAVGRQSGPPQPGERAPAFEAPLLTGSGDFALGDVAGKPVLLNFWASWCAPCRDEARYLTRAHETYRGRVEFVGVDIKDARSDAVAFAERHGLEYTLVRDTGEIYDAYGLTGQPETFLIDAEGTIVEHVAGPFLSEQDLFGLLDVLVARDG
jgi:cytochrome c biogenesis protein CcmG/thiol:disulfide interchange protein DsbE